MWLIADYAASALFSLKPATATASGGKTLLVPTPFAIKMALLDIAIRLEGRERAAAAWDEWIGAARVALCPPERIVVNNTFIKVLRPRRNPAAPGSQHAGFFQQTIAYREYAQWDDVLGLAFELGESADVERLSRWLFNINYLGKRGSFVQLQGPPQQVETLPDGYIVIDGDLGTMSLNALLAQLDDVGEGTPFAQVDIYSGKRIQLGKQRVLRHVALPYRLVASSRGYSFYERQDGDS
jgi:hypothetical protein